MKLFRFCDHPVHQSCYFQGVVLSVHLMDYVGHTRQTTAKWHLFIFGRKKKKTSTNWHYVRWISLVSAGKMKYLLHNVDGFIHEKLPLLSYIIALTDVSSIVVSLKKKMGEKYIIGDAYLTQVTFKHTYNSRHRWRRTSMLHHMST